MPTPRAPMKANLAEKFAQFDEHWAPKIIARYNDNEVRLVKTSGEWVWHKLFGSFPAGAKAGADRVTGEMNRQLNPIFKD